MVTQTKTLGSSLISSFSFPTSIHCISTCCQLYLQNISVIQTLLITPKQPLWTNPQSSPLPILQQSGNCLASTFSSLQCILKPRQHCSDPSSVFSLHMITSPNLVGSYVIHPLTSLSSSPPTLTQTAPSHPDFLAVLWIDQHTSTSGLWKWHFPCLQSSSLRDDLDSLVISFSSLVKSCLLSETLPDNRT